ncbi:Ubiquitin carboxyl-terminal hydrolase 26 [Amphibalanus amphitrite]|uniref:ubiquitinyl hydrolase 1 n=1 Tax=Amphibalanus amphitrite TaxID=1232801 RepID=A0A6A4V8T1_AMPAM|nr:Ubiquitin carboxyl-terminal hydrolase 26 [Amphibalanus amphitrite]
MVITRMDDIRVFGILDDYLEIQMMVKKLPKYLVDRWKREVDKWLYDEKGEDQSLRPVDLVGDFTYRLVGVVSHYGGATHSGHYVSDVYSVGRDMWFHFDDQRVSCVDEAYSMSKKYVP